MFYELNNLYYWSKWSFGIYVQTNLWIIPIMKFVWVDKYFIDMKSLLQTLLWRVYYRHYYEKFITEAS